MTDKEKKSEYTEKFLKAVEEKRKWLEENPDTHNWTGADFEFSIQRADEEFSPYDIGLENCDYDEVMTPNSFTVNKIMKNNWNWYQVGEDEFTYSEEASGIQMVFNDEITFVKAKKIVDEVISNIEKCTGNKIILEIKY